MSEMSVLDVRCAVRLGDFVLDADFAAGPGITVLFGRRVPARRRSYILSPA